MRKGYSDSPFGQIHWRMIAPEDVSLPDLYCFHPAPFSGLAWTTIMPHLAKGRRVIAPDYPGYGGSDQHTQQPTIDDYASAMLAVMDDFSSDSACDVAGFHTGCLIAAELGRIAPTRVRRAVLIDTPAFEPEACEKMLATVAQPLTLTPELDCLASAWESGVSKRLPSQPMARAFEMFVEQIRPGADMNAAFHAAFSYPWKDRFPEVLTTTMVLATQSPLLEGSRKAPALLPNATLVERLDIKRAVLDEAAEETVSEVLKFLNDDQSSLPLL